MHEIIKPFDDKDSPYRVLTTEEALADIAMIPYPSERKLRENRCIEDLVNLDPEKGVFYSNKRRNGKLVGVAVALEQALKAVGEEGVVASLPYLIAGKAKADKGNYLWQDWFTPLSEEHVGIDKRGRRGKKGTAYVVILHGGGLLTPMRIFQAYDEGLTDRGAAKLKPEEFDELLQGSLPSSETIEIYTVEDVKNGKIPFPFGKYAVIMDFETAQKTKSYWLTKEEFMNNPLVKAQAGTLEYLDDYFEKAKAELNGNLVVANWHPFKSVHPDQPQGRVLFVDVSINGLNGNFLDYDGRSVGVSGGAVARGVAERR